MQWPAPFKLIWFLGIFGTIASADPIYLLTTEPSPRLNYSHTIWEYTVANPKLTELYKFTTTELLDQPTFIQSGTQPPYIFAIERYSRQLVRIDPAGNIAQPAYPSGVVSITPNSPSSVLVLLNNNEIFAADTGSAPWLQSMGTATTLLQPLLQPNEMVRGIQRVDQNQIAVLTSRSLIFIDQNFAWIKADLKTFDAVLFLCNFNGIWFVDKKRIAHNPQPQHELMYLSFRSGVTSGAHLPPLLDQIALLDIEPQTEDLRMRFGAGDVVYTTRQGNYPSIYRTLDGSRFSPATLANLAPPGRFNHVKEVVFDVPRTAPLNFSRTITGPSIWGGGTVSQAPSTSATPSTPAVRPLRTIDPANMRQVLEEGLKKVKAQTRLASLPDKLPERIPVWMLAYIVNRDPVLQDYFATQNPSDMDRAIVAQHTSQNLRGRVPRYEDYLQQHSLVDPLPSLRAWLKSYHVILRYGYLEVEPGYEDTTLPLPVIANEITNVGRFNQRLRTLLNLYTSCLFLLSFLN